MRIIKTNTHKFDNFYRTLPSVTRSKNSSLHYYEKSSTYSNPAVREEIENNILDTLYDFYKDINNAALSEEVFSIYNKYINNIIALKELDVYFFDSTKQKLNALMNKKNNVLAAFINKANKEGILEWVSSRNKFKIIPDSNEFLSNKGERNTFILFPLGIKNNINGFIVLYGNTQELNHNKNNSELFELLSFAAGSKFESLKKSEELISVYNELQVYQSKLSNDFKLSAIGELTFGIVEEILSSLQVIEASTDFLDQSTDSDSITTIQQQVAKVKNVIGRLIKFSDVSDKKVKIQPCNLNELINIFYNVIIPSLKKVNYECLLDLEKNLLPVLSYPNVLNQVLANIFTLFKPINREGGIVIQTRNLSDKIVLRVITTDHIRVSPENQSMSLKIIDQLMKKHEGEYKINASKASGTTISLIFPLKRRIRK